MNRKTMSGDRGFAATVIESGASALGSYAAERLFELAPETRTQFADGAAESWRAHLSSRLIELAAAVRLGEPRLFVSRVLWARRAFVYRDVPTQHLETSLVALEDVLLRELSDGLSEGAIPILREAREALGRAPRDGRDEAGGVLKDERALRYLAAVLEGDARRAVDLLVAMVDAGAHARDVILEVLVPAQREIGRMWHAADSDVAEEHLLTATTIRALSVLGTLGRAEPSNGRTVVIAAVQGNQHDIAVCALGILFEWAGWKSIVLGANVPTFDLIRSVQYFDADLLVLSVALATQLGDASRTIVATQSVPGLVLPVMVGGSAFEDGDELWRRIGADGYASSLETAVDEGLRLVTASRG
ncbi:MAG: B12-binding domain-containing protein [Candidatus Eisenbacteria bacterium]